MKGNVTAMEINVLDELLLLVTSMCRDSSDSE